MKHLPLILPAIVLIACGSPDQAPTPADGSDTLSGKITLSGAYALYPLAVKWGEEYTKLHPAVSFDIQGGGAGKGMTDAVTGTVDLGMVSRDIGPEETVKGAFGFAVAKDAVVPTVNAGNPYLAELKKKGLTREQLTQLWLGGKIITWGELLGNGAKEEVSVYMRSDASGAGETWAKYLGKAQEDLEGVGVFGDPGVAEAVGKDPFAIGFNNIGFVYDLRTGKPYPTIAVAPIDVNGNGTIDPEEDFYDDLTAITKAIMAGAYPSPPARPLYFVSKGKPQTPLVIAFLDWVLGEGQRHVVESGYVPLPDSLLQGEREKLPAGATSVAP